MFHFFFRESQHGPQIVFVAVELGFGVLHGQRDDVRFDEVEEIAVGIGADLVERALLAIAEKV